jgi:hypothetical protein
MDDSRNISADELIEVARLAAHVHLTRDEAVALIQEYSQSAATPRSHHGERKLEYGELKALLASGRFEAYEEGRFFVAVSLAEAETLRRAVHVRQGGPLLDGSRTQLALRVNDQHDTVLDATTGWKPAPEWATSSSHAALAYFDGRAYYPEPRLNVLLRALAPNAREARRRFYSQTLGCRRRLARRWQQTPLAKVDRDDVAYKDCLP